jgi:xylan 1,4-beta-xylosidase
MKKQTIVADLKEEGKNIGHPWNSCISIGQACEGLRTDWVKQLTIAVKECGFRYLHMNGLLSDNMFVYYEEEGISYYNWQYIDSLFDTLLEIGIRPYVEFSFMPNDLAKEKNPMFWWERNTTPPKDYQRWSNLISALLKHWAQRYGMYEIENWYYEVWSEANRLDYWGGTKEEYFELYQVTAETLKKVNINMQIGGPSIQLGKEGVNSEDSIQWLEDFLEFCSSKHLPLDFISIHSYGAIKEEVRKLHEIITNSVYNSAKLYVNEFCSSESHRDYSHDGLPMATYLIHHTFDTMELVDAVSYRGLSDLSEDVKGPPKSFHGGMGLMNMQGIKKPSYHAYRMLNLLGTKLLKKEEGCLITKNLDDEVRAIFYNYPVELWDTLPCSPYPYQDVSKEIEQLGDIYKLSVTLHNLQPEVTLVLEILDEKHGDVIKRWRAMGSPSGLALYEVKELKDLSDTTMKLYFTADEEGTAKLQFTLRPFAIANLLQN